MESVEFCGNYRLHDKISLTAAKKYQFTTHGADLTGTVFMVIPTKQDTTAGTLSGAPIVFLIPETDAGYSFSVILNCFASAAF